MTDPEAIRAGLDRGEFFLEYLPTMELDSGRCVGAEAPSRWRRGNATMNPFEVLDLTQDGPPRFAKDNAGRLLTLPKLRTFSASIRPHPDSCQRKGPDGVSTRPRQRGIVPEQ